MDSIGRNKDHFTLMQGVKNAVCRYFDVAAQGIYQLVISVKMGGVAEIFVYKSIAVVVAVGICYLMLDQKNHQP